MSVRSRFARSSIQLTLSLALGAAALAAPSAARADVVASVRTPIQGAPPDAPQPDAGQEPARPDPGTALFIVGADYEIGGRRVSYNDLIIENQRTFGVMGAPVISLSAEAYPAARTKMNVVRDLGLVISYAGALGVDASLPDGTKMGVSWHRADVGARYRLRLGAKPNAPLLMATLGYSFATFAFTAPAPYDTQVPSVTYHSLRLGVDGRVPLGPVALRVGAGYRKPIAAGAMLERFRDGMANAIDLNLGVAVPIVRGLEARVGAEYTRYFYSFYPERGDPFIAGGALDEYVGIKIGAAYVH